MRNGKGLERKLTLILLAFAVIISAAIGGIGYKTYIDSTFAKYGQTAASVLKLARGLIDADDMKACLASGKKSAAYEETQAALDRIKEDMEVAYIYLFDMAADGSISYYITAVAGYERKNSASAHAELNSLGDRDRFPDDVTRQLLEIGGESSLTEIINRTQYGYMLSVYSPVKDSKGEKIGLLGVDFAMRKIHADLTAYFETVVLGAAVTAVSFAALLIFFVRRNVTGPIRFLAEKASEFASADPNANELSAVKLHMRNKDEIGMLASAFEKMTEDLVRYVSELTVTVAVQGRIESELHVARNIQAGILPATFPAFPQWDEFDLYASMAPVREVGGDLYDFFMMDESHVALIIGDVSGKGVPAALFMMVVRTLIKNEIHFGGAPHEVFERVNRTLCENNNACMFVTAFVCFYDVETGLLKYASAGHNPPVIVKSGGEAKTLESPSSLVLALDETARYSSRETVLEPGDCILLYTDGVTEAFSDKEEMFSEARLIEAVAFPASGKDRAREVIERVADRLRIFTNGAKQSDDIAMLALARRDGADREDRCVEMDEKRTEESLAEKVFPRVEGKDQSARTFRSDVNCLDAVQAFVRGLMEKAGIAGDVMGRVELVVEEVFVNIADYAYKGSGSSGEIAVRCGADPEIVSLEFVDNGPAFNPLERRDPNVNLGVYEREPRGLGIFIVKKVMDVLEYRREDGKNILSMSKNLKKPA